MGLVIYAGSIFCHLEINFYKRDWFVHPSCRAEFGTSDVESFDVVGLNFSKKTPLVSLRLSQCGGLLPRNKKLADSLIGSL